MNDYKVLQMRMAIAQFIHAQLNFLTTTPTTTATDNRLMKIQMTRANWGTVRRGLKFRFHALRSRREVHDDRRRGVVIKPDKGTSKHLLRHQ